MPAAQVTDDMDCTPARPDLLFTLELGDLPGSGVGQGVEHTLRSADARERLRCLTATRSLFECRLLRDVRAFLSAIVREEGRPDTVVLASKLAAVGYRLTIRTALGGGAGRSCFHNLHHEFLLVLGDPELGTPQDKEFIVDPNFREQFSIPQATPAFDDIVRQLPSEFVGPASRLVPLVQLLCNEMGHAFAARGMACPPWRQAKAMLSKWLPAKVRDVGVASGYCKEGACDSLSPGISPRTPLELYQESSANLSSPVTPISNSETSRPQQAWWSKGRDSSGSDGASSEQSPGPGSGQGSGQSACSRSSSGGSSSNGMGSRSSSIRLERSTSLLSRNLASKARPQAASSQETLAAKLQKAALDCFLSDEQPPIRRVKMGGLHAVASKLVAA